MSQSSNSLPQHYSAFVALMNTLPPGSETSVATVNARNEDLARPVGTLGALNDLVAFVARWQETPRPTIESPMVAVFAATHGVHERATGDASADFTKQMVADLTDGGSAVAQVCAMHELNLRIFELALDLPTGDITHQPAMDDRTCAATLAYGMEAIAGGPDLLCIGEVGAGNDWTAAAVAAAIYGGSGAEWATDVPHSEGDGLDAATLIDAALAHHAADLDHPLKVLARLGGRELAASLGAIVAARHLKIPVIIDGFVATVAASVAFAINPDLIAHCLFAQAPGQSVQAKLIDRMGTRALLDLGITLGEGTGAALAAVMVKTALKLHRDMEALAQAPAARH